MITTCPEKTISSVTLFMGFNPDELHDCALGSLLGVIMEQCSAVSLGKMEKAVSAFLALTGPSNATSRETRDRDQSDGYQKVVVVEGDA